MRMRAKGSLPTLIIRRQLISEEIRNGEPTKITDGQ